MSSAFISEPRCSTGSSAPGVTGILYCIAALMLLAVGPASACTIYTIDAGTANIINTTVANAIGGDIIILNPGTYTETGILVDKDLTIQANTSYGGTAANTIIDGNNAGRIMNVTSGVTATIDNLTFTKGNGGGDSGGAIYNEGTLTITSSTFSSCTASDGGAIESDGGATLNIISSTFSSCSATNGGAITSSGTMSISRSSFSSCSATSAGGAVNGHGTIDASTFSSCTANMGGALFLQDSSTITSSSFKSCSATNSGGAIYAHSGISTIEFSRFYQNTASSGSTIFSVVGTISSAKYNWWGVNSPDIPAITTSLVAGKYTPWLVLGTGASPASITSAQTSAVDANLTYDSAGTYHAPAGGHVPDELAITFSSTCGSLSPTSGWSLLDGKNTTTFTPSNLGTTTISATIDGETVTVPVTVSGPAFSGSPTTGTAPLTVTFTDASVGSPTMWNWSFGDGTWFNTTSSAAASPTHTYSSAGTYNVNLTVTVGAGTATLEKAGYVTVSAAASSGSGTGTTYYNPGGGGSDSDSTTGTGQAGTGQQPSTGGGTPVDVNVGGNSAVTGVSLTGTGLSGIVVTGTVMDGPPSGVPSAPGTSYQYIDLVPASYTSITGAEVTFTVPVSWLESQHFTPQDIVLYHYDNGVWTALPTTVVSTANGVVTFQATTPHFSIFAIIGKARTDTPASQQQQTFGDLAGTTGTSPAPGLPSYPQPSIRLNASQPAENEQQGFPLPMIFLTLAGVVILAASGFLARREYRRRQNPGLFDDE